MSSSYFPTTNLHLVPQINYVSLYVVVIILESESQTKCGGRGNVKYNGKCKSNDLVRGEEEGREGLVI